MTDAKNEPENQADQKNLEFHVSDKLNQPDSSVEPTSEVPTPIAPPEQPIVNTRPPSEIPHIPRPAYVNTRPNYDLEPPSLIGELPSLEREPKAEPDVYVNTNFDRVPDFIADPAPDPMPEPTTNVDPDPFAIGPETELLEDAYVNTNVAEDPSRPSDIADLSELLKPPINVNTNVPKAIPIAPPPEPPRVNTNFQVRVPPPPPPPPPPPVRVNTNVPPAIPMPPPRVNTNVPKLPRKKPPRVNTNVPPSLKKERPPRVNTNIPKRRPSVKRLEDEAPKPNPFNQPRVNTNTARNLYGDDFDTSPAPPPNEGIPPRDSLDDDKS